MSKKSSEFRALAIFLAFIASGWGVFCAGLMLEGDPVRGIVFFGPGYVVTLGYFLLGFTVLAPEFRKIWWGASALVQGAWFFGTLPILWGCSVSDCVNPFTIWWGIAFAVSVYGLVCDTGEDELFVDVG